MTMITPSYLGETIEYSSLHACRSTLEDPTNRSVMNELNRATTMANRRPVASSFPCKALTVSGTGSICSFVFFSVISVPSVVNFVSTQGLSS